MDSTMVIKVKYGDTLRRFNASIGDNQQLDLDMNSLRAKILGLFNFPPDANITLRYIDEDGDVVTLVEDEDLCDVMRQRLKFLRIEVLFNNEKGGEYARSSGNSTPLRSPCVQYPLPNVDANLTEALNLVPVPEPLKEVISKLSVDLASKATSTNPVLGEFVEFFSKLGQSYMSSVSQSQSGVSATTETESSEIPVVPAVSGGPSMSKDASILDNGPKYSPGDSTSNGGQKLGINGVTRGVGSLTVPVVPTPVNPNQDPPVGSESDPYGAIPSGSFDTASANHKKETKQSGDGNVHQKPLGFGASSSFTGPRWYPVPKSNQTAGLSGTPFKKCPFSGTPLANDSFVSVPRRIHPFKRSFTFSDAMGGIFHKGVRCDGCGVHPITGPRFKSKVKDDYDLCSICFAETGNEVDYIRMDRPVSYRHPRFCKGLYGHNQNGWVGHPTPTPPSQIVFGGHGLKSDHPKLDSRFISDITVMDGTMMAPSTQFTKIWRMHNNGNLVWPQGTQLLWIGGDRFTDAVSVELEIPENGVPSDGQLDIAVDFIAPALPGRYISYWRMSSSSGHKFGQRVWVLVQVDALLADSVCDSLGGLNLNLPPNCSGSKSHEMIDINVKPTMEGDLLESANSNKEADTVNPVGIELPKQDQELNFPINDALLVGQSAPASAPPVAPSSLSYPLTNMSEAAFHGPSSVPYPVVDSPVSQVVKLNEEKEIVEQTLLKELEEMGFKQVDLNKEILRLNEYDLEQSVDDLCGVADWDPMLEELEEMGFHNTELNRRLLKKNDGSIKRVVMDLINGQKA